MKKGAMTLENNFVPCYRISDSKGNKVIVKGNLEKWMKNKLVKCKVIKDEKRYYIGKYRIFIEVLSPEVMMTMQYVFNNEKYNPTHV